MDHQYRLMSARKFGPKQTWHPAGICPACHKPFKVGDYTTLIELGPGDDRENQEKARAGRPYTAVAVEVHWSCATGEPNEPDTA